MRTPPRPAYSLYMTNYESAEPEAEEAVEISDEELHASITEQFRAAGLTSLRLAQRRAVGRPRPRGWGHRW